MRALSTLLVLALFAASGSLSVAQTPSPAPSVSPAATPSPIELARGRLDTMLRTGHADPAWFSASFLAQVPAKKLDEILASISGALGTFDRVEFASPKFVAHFSRGTDDVLLHLDTDLKIDGLLFKPPVLNASSLSDALGGFDGARGTVSYVIIEEGGSDKAALRPSAPLAVGSAFKLAVLNALRDRIDRGAAHWNDVVPLRAEWKTLPTGVLRTWPERTPLTLATYATEMISISDNTAADALVRIVGPASLQPYASANAPFLTTREMFTLKSTIGASLAQAYLAARTPKERSSVLARTDALPLPAAEQLMHAPQPAIEWHYSVRELCRLIKRVADLPLMSVNPGVADPADFRHVAFKGGSDLGIINLTTSVTTLRGTKLCFSATENDPQQAIDETAFETTYAAVLSQLARQ